MGRWVRSRHAGAITGTIIDTVTRETVLTTHREDVADLVVHTPELVEELRHCVALLGTAAPEPAVSLLASLPRQ